MSLQSAVCGKRVRELEGKRVRNLEIKIISSKLPRSGWRGGWRVRLES
jgi:hypothetical protein